MKQTNVWWIPHEKVGLYRIHENIDNIAGFMLSHVKTASYDEFANLTDDISKIDFCTWEDTHKRYCISVDDTGKIIAVD